MSKKQDILPDDESLKREFPLLHSISKENPFSVPESYFDSLPSEILEKCHTVGNGSKSFPTKAEAILTTLLSYKWRLLTVAGCAAIICIFVPRLNNRPVSYEAMVQTIPDSLIVKQLDNNIADINVSTLEELQEPGLFAKSKSDSANTDQIIAYLIDNNVSVSEIENEP